MAGPSQKTQDFLMAYDMHKELNCLGVTENAIYSGKENYRPKTLIDRSLELIDPTPNIHTLFVQFNGRFFWNILVSVEVKWSNKMTSSAGSCSFHPRNKQCVITLSAPLLKLRPRKDLVETLLHEMIHGYLFLTNNDRDRDGHGPNFCKHMNRINKEAGTNITIYHNFHDEVELYQQHWWKCNGPCQYKPPFFGTVRRAINRAPGPSDYWWREHKKNCNGQFIKIREPKNFKSHSKRNNKSKLISKNNWFIKNNSTINNVKSTFTSLLSNSNSKTFTQTNMNKSTNSKDGNHFPDNDRNKDLQLGIKKLGNTSNNVHGWSTSGPNGKIEKDNIKNIKSPKFACSGTVGGSKSGQSNLLEKFLHINNDEGSPIKLRKKDLSLKSQSTAKEKSTDNPLLNSDRPKNDFVPCPVCNVLISLKDINKHVDLCLMSDNKVEEKIETINNTNEYKIKFSSSINDLKSGDFNDIKYVSCPICNRMRKCTDINQHLDECLLESDIVHKTSIPSNFPISIDDSTISINSSSSSNLDNSLVIDNSMAQVSSVVSTDENDTTNYEQKCLVCNAQIEPEMSLNEHLEECIGSVFNDDMMIIDDKDAADDDDVSIVKNNCIENNYPCPVCMKIISEYLMNEHLDICLESK